MRGRWIQYSKAELAFIKANCTLLRSELYRQFQERFERPDVSMVNINSLCKRRGWVTGRSGRFEKGHVPAANARPKGPNKTSFKKGQMPHNWKPVGSTRLSKDGYLEKKVKEPKTWRQVHVMEWEKANGKVPAGFCLRFKDGDKTNITLDNLELTSRNVNLQLNRLHYESQPDPLKPIVKTLGSLIAKAGEVRRGAG